MRRAKAKSRVAAEALYFRRDVSARCNWGAELNVSWTPAGAAAAVCS